ncbi:hypothetical protein J2Y03_003284 [Neobacillus niacini]|nr:hypothetical protein [Neobacillus niacini]
MRVISLCPSNTEIMEYLGLTHLLGILAMMRVKF